MPKSLQKDVEHEFQTAMDEEFYNASKQFETTIEELEDLEDERD